MKPLKFKIISFNEVMEFINDKSIPSNWLDEYLLPRHDILTNVDIFCENCRTKNIPKHFKAFNLFKQVKDDPDFYVCALYLELLEYHKKYTTIIDCISHFCKKYDKTVVFYWNHDVDFAKYSSYIEHISNVKILNYNTSLKTKNDIIVPFWQNMPKEFIQEEKTIRYGYSCNITNPGRQALYDAFKNDHDFSFNIDLPKDEYYKKCGSYIFSFCPRGDGLSSVRFFESFLVNSIPVLFTNKIVLPYEDIIDYSKISIKIDESHIADYNYICNILNNFDIENANKEIKRVQHLFMLDTIQKMIYNNLI